MSLRDRLPVVPRWGRRILWLGALAAVVAAILTPAVSQWWSQRAEIRAGEDELALLEADNDQLRDRLDKIGDPATLERIARRDLGLVREGEESYTVLPPSTAGVVLPDSWPFDRVAPAMARARNSAGDGP
ncbi:MAG: septum formation initiator family protein [Microthrixaceae bacterium]|nr:septum formation initiator family protein [Microthrixaceae bacterium]MCB9387047.1 septum formation initiator family protein [Microthrixaceae bacterium]MCO5321580.1 septum formation initiator family protein [Microthrixaceae bacterium]